LAFFIHTTPAVYHGTRADTNDSSSAAAAVGGRWQHSSRSARLSCDRQGERIDPRIGNTYSRRTFGQMKRGLKIRSRCKPNVF
jgi:uncharacterized protein with von Willebrand factor type A (vWA) domain